MARRMQAFRWVESKPVAPLDLAKLGELVRELTDTAKGVDTESAVHRTG